ncbi:MAG: hypothetical protein IJB70_07985 [Clostridia bacterium]|nr:hypothetical protein [Clostridia bacterium]
MATNNKKGSLLTFVDSMFVVAGEMIEQNGEDSYSYCLGNKFGYIGVFDGCGGIGSRKYENYDNKTGAYIASHVSGLTMLDWFKKFCAADYELSSNNIKNICDSIKDNLERELKIFESSSATAAIKGSLTKNFPTTASMILFTSNKTEMYAAYIWAGDSRGFLLTEDGLFQVTTDDIEIDGDAMENLSNDSKLTNMVCADGDFKLNSRIISGEEKGIFVTATDGFFAYFSTPMEFEFMIIDSMLASDSVETWKSQLANYIKKYTGDDFTMGVTVYGYKTFKALKKSYFDRHNVLYTKYISKLADMSDEEKVNLWNDYKKNYYRGD